MKRQISKTGGWKIWARYGAGMMAVLLFTASAKGQTFSSGSNGSDGALNLTTPGTILFDPKTFNPPLDPDGDNVYHFTTINVGAGVTVKLSGKVLNGPLYWLASGDVTIDGTVDLNGEMGHPESNSFSDRVPSSPGAGGYGGGLGSSSGNPPQPGNGPGGGAAAASSNPNRATDGSFTGNQFLVPLVGGSGGGGAFSCSAIGNGGGAGGGAILIASSSSILIRSTGKISADGGDFATACGTSGSGSGGAIRLIATQIAGGGMLSARQAGNGRIRLEAFQDSFTGSFNATPFSRSTPFKLFVPINPPSSLRVSSIAGISINANPFTFPDVNINTSSPVTVQVEGRFIPIGTVVKLYVFSETGPDQTIDTTPLQGSFQQSTASASVSLPPGGSRGFVRATWQP